MKFRSILLFLAASGLLLGISATAFADGDATPPEGLQEYSIDAGHSSVVFRIKHNDMG